MSYYFPEEVLEQILKFMKSSQDRNSVSLVCKTWFEVERGSRSHVLVRNCYTINPERVIKRFPRLRALTLKGKPHYFDYNVIPNDWGGFVYPWIKALTKGCPALEELHLKRMVVSDDNLELISKSFVHFKSLVLFRCVGFTTNGLTAIAANCRYLEELDLQEIKIVDDGHWLSCFPDTCTSLVSLNFACLRGVVDSAALVRLVARNPNLRSLKLNRSVPFETLHHILAQAPQLVDLGIGSIVHAPDSETYNKFNNVVSKCKSIRSLSGFLQHYILCLPAIYPLCSNLTSLNLSNACGINGSVLTKLISICNKLQRLWTLDCIGNEGLAVVASTCKELEELRVLSGGFAVGSGVLTEEGLVAISRGCPKLQSVLYLCCQMTNAGLITVAENCRNITSFILKIQGQKKLDAVTGQPLDEGFCAIVQLCKQLKRLSFSGYLTDKVFLFIGMYAEQLEMLSVAFAGDNDDAITYVLNGCEKLKKLEIRNCLFGNSALLMDMGRFEAIRSFWMSSCGVTLGACKLLAKKMPRLNVEIINNNKLGQADVDDDQQIVEKMYLYRTLIGPRHDAPAYVRTL